MSQTQLDYQTGLIAYILNIRHIDYQSTKYKLYQVRGAGLDVFDSELPEEIDQRIIDHPHIIATGHYAWYSENSLDELQKRAAQNMAALLRNETIEDSLN